METMDNEIGNLMNNIEIKINQVTQMRKLIDQQLYQIEYFFQNKNKILSKLTDVQLALKQISNAKTIVEQQLLQMKQYTLFTIEQIKKMYENTLLDMKTQFSREICERDNQLQKQLLITRSLKQQISLMKLKLGNDFKFDTNKNTKSPSSIFKPHRLSLDFNYNSKQSTDVQFKMIKSSFNSPQMVEQVSISKQDLLDISPSSIKKQNQSLFEQLQDINSKRKQFMESIPFEAEQSRVQQSLQNSQINVFAKLTFGKDKVKCITTSPIKHQQEKKLVTKQLLFQKYRQSKNSSYQPLQQMFVKQTPNVLESKRTSTNLDQNRKQNRQNIRINEKRVQQQQKYLANIKSVFRTQNLIKKNTQVEFYVGDPMKQIKYQGLKKEGKKFAKGIVYYSDGLMYQGQFQNNLRSGFGSLQYQYVQIYSGDWQNDKMQGQGKLKNCMIINQNNKTQSKTNPFSHWISYMGSFKNNTFNGYGQLQLKNEQKFYGDFVNGKVEGQGTYYKKSGQVLFGIWKANKFIKQT